MQRDQVVVLRKTGMSWPKISKQLGIPRSTCQRHMDRGFGWRFRTSEDKPDY